MPPKGDQSEGNTGANARPDTTVTVGNLRLLRTGQDVFGSQRRKPHVFISPAEPAAMESQHPPRDASALGTALAAMEINEIYVRWPRRRAGELDAILGQLQSAGFQNEDAWPTLPLIDAADDELTLRVSRPAPHINSPFELSYTTERQRHAIAEDDHTLIVSLQSEIEAAAARAIHDTAFDAKYHVRHVMNVGSSSRGTYTTFPADFDIVIDTERERTLIDPEDARGVCDKIIKAVRPSQTFARFVERIGCKTDRATDFRPGIVLESFGVRGPQSLVARYDLVGGSSLAAEGRIGFLDVTFGKLPQLIGYETWIRRLFEQLGPLSAERLRSEIRLAKSLLKGLGGVYGTAARGLRAHAVEQWVIQSLNYRASGLKVGTFENALHLIAEESGPNSLGRDTEALLFEDYAKRFPLRHPGWWETETAQSDRRNVNLWDLLGDGDMALAPLKWRKFVALALAFEHLRNCEQEWSLETLLRSSEAILRSDGARQA